LRHATSHQHQRADKTERKQHPEDGARQVYPKVAERIFFAIDPEYDGDRDASRDFWECATGGRTNYPETKFVQGFVNGAIEVWNEVKDQI
jgi:hypothetical protein